MAVSYTPATGVTASVTLNSTTLCASEWTFDERINVLPAPSFCGGAYMEYAFGKKSAAYSFSGVWDLGRNPFALGFKLGQSVTFTERINNVVIMTSPNVTITEWQISDQADGLCTYTCSLIGDFIFNDFSNTPG